MIFEKIRVLVPFGVLLLIGTGVSATTCYWRNGSPTLEGYTPCNATGVSMCCLIGGGEKCNAIGICNGGGILSVEACTDQTWKSPACSPLCPNQPEGAGGITECDNGSFCCSTDESCCSKNQGIFLNGSTASNTPSISNSNSTFTSSDFHLIGAPNSWHFIVENAWLSTAIIAALGWIHTWYIGMILAKHKKLDPRHVADGRLAGLAKRTSITAFLADEDTAYPKNVIGYLAGDPGISTTLSSLYECKASFLNYTEWVVQFGAVIYAVFIASFVWSKDNTVKVQSPWLQFPLLLGCLNINRSTWSIAVAGCFLPGPGRRRRIFLICTTVLALTIDAVFIARAFLMAWHINSTAPAAPSKWTGILAWALPAIEGLIFFIGIFFGYYNIERMKKEYFICWIPNFWLFFGPLFIIGVSIASHFNKAFLGVA